MSLGIALGVTAVVWAICIAAYFIWAAAATRRDIEGGAKGSER